MTELGIFRLLPGAALLDVPGLDWRDDAGSERNGFAEDEGVVGDDGWIPSVDWPEALSLSGVSSRLILCCAFRGRSTWRLPLRREIDSV